MTLFLFTAGCLAITKVAAAVTLAEFGFDHKRVNGFAANGTARTPRPLLTVMVDFSDRRFQRRHSPTYFTTLLFTDSRSINGYYIENSSGRFRFRNAGIVGPLTHRNDPATPANESRELCAWGATCPGRSVETVRGEAVRLAASRVDFKSFDTNNNGTVSDDELVMLLVDASPPGVGATWGITRPSAPGCISTGSGARAVNVCLGTIPGVEENAAFETVAHELAHTLGADEVYGSSCNSQNLSLMSCTVGGDDDVVSLYHLDPWHKMALGWSSPSIADVAGSGCATLSAADVTSNTPQLLYDSRRGSGEYYLVEFRNPTAPPGFYDANVASSGVAPWYVRQNANHSLAIEPRPGASTTPPPMDAVDYVMGPPDTPGGAIVRASTRLWTKSDGVAFLPWQDGRWFELRVGEFNPFNSAVEIEWRPAGASFTTLVTSAIPSTMRPGSIVVLRGTFGFRPADGIVRLANFLRTVDVTPSVWTCNTIMFQVPSGTPADPYLIGVAGTGLFGRLLPVTVNP